MQPLTLAFVALAYLLFLFLVAYVGDRRRYTQMAASRSTIYPLSLAVYCTTWTFFGSVGLATTSGIDFLSIYIGPILMMTVGYPIMRKIVAISKRQRITSIADFVGARYGKSVTVAAVATIIAVIGGVPYIMLQLKAVADSVQYMVLADNPDGASLVFFDEISLIIVLALAVFTILFGTRHADATEHQDGMMLAVALESAIKLFAFLAIGIFVTYVLFDGVGDLYSQAVANAEISKLFETGFNPTNMAVLTMLSFTVFLLLPRQFHVAVVENHSERELQRARWLFPLYLVLINLFVLPIAAAGMLSFGNSLKGDVYVLALPAAAGNDALALLAFIGGLSAGSAMVIVACVALAIMISNHLVLPVYLRNFDPALPGGDLDMEKLILRIRRMAITVLLLLAYVYYRLSDGSQALASIGLVSFAAIAQLGPAVFGGLFWRGANAVGSIAGMTVGISVWLVILFLPTIDSEVFYFGSAVHSALGMDMLGFTSFATGLFVSMLFNALAWIIGSLLAKPTPLEDHQATAFVLFERNAANPSSAANNFLTIGEIRDNLYRYLGQLRADRALANYWGKRAEMTDPREIASNDLIRYSEETLASAIGASSSRLVHSLLLRRFEETSTANLRLLDQATEAIEYNQNVLRTAFDQLEQGITVFDAEMKLSFWNRQFRRLLDLPENIGQAGTPLNRVVFEIARRHRMSEKDTSFDDLENRLLTHGQTWGLALYSSEKILEIQSSPMPSGGLVIAWNDVTERVMVSEALKEANESLEKRVEERTRDLVRANIQLEQAHKEAELANQSKTRFLAAAGHDLMQPLNAARLYTSTLMETSRSPKANSLGEKISMSLESVEEILGSVLAISRLDSASHKINISSCNLQKMLSQMELEFSPIAAEKGLDIKFMPSSMWVRSDPAYLRRLLQNLVSNSIKYTSRGRILVGCRRRGDRVAIQVIDTGIGMTAKEQRSIFNEFERLDTGARLAPGLGLGLSIVERISKLLHHPIRLFSEPGRGTMFEISVPRAVAEAVTLIEGKAPRRVAMSRLTGLTVLCIDNDRNILEGMSGLLAQWGCSVHTAVDRDGALSCLRMKESLPHIALVDYHLDKDNGLDLIHAFRAAGGEDIPCILVTADRSTELRQRAEAIGVSVLNKPLKPAALRALLSQRANQTKQAAAE